MHKGTFRGLEVAAKKVFDTGRTSISTNDFDREVAMLAQLVHPNIMSIIGVSESPDGESIIVSARVEVYFHARVFLKSNGILTGCFAGAGILWRR